MSASLVGSEMCIRDRSQAEPPLTAAGLPVRAQRAALREYLHACSSKPVSYTHLTLPTICSV
eukprot:13674912-Alexandrium_andersonii.AAC.1